jgi:hypothetical protein
VLAEDEDEEDEVEDDQVSWFVTAADFVNKGHGLGSSSRDTETNPYRHPTGSKPREACTLLFPGAEDPFCIWTLS